MSAASPRVEKEGDVPPYDILTVGDGDFTFTLALAKTLTQETTIVGSSFDSKEQLLKKYGQTNESRVLLDLKRFGSRVSTLHGVDGTRLRETLSEEKRARRFGHIVFNHPHTGVEDLHR